MDEQKTPDFAENDPDSTLRDRLADAVASEASFEGWTRAALASAARGLDLPAGEGERLFPGGPLDVLTFLSRRSDLRMVEDMEKEGVVALKIRDRIKGAVRIRLERHSGQRESARRALSLLSLPFNAPLALKLLYGTVDAMWYAAGDTSTDFNFYTKRATLAGVYSSTLLYWLNDRSPGAEATWAFLDRRIDDVMRIEKLKGQVRSWTNPKQAAAGPAARR
ncbi:COQ9 family protein [Reyranella sp. MMS21-HV4-11]|jgi:ubiquinone biosynthesis protein COQ9|uniref:COQ9 family protein n=1 Tax=Reyranella humidisoli TaxID=2849149 RepID=A0ABS6IPQ3_9HYPH|nr:COQ9 family protein [Reyranella sp. MMS21-HV4-11]MBU8876577.1 COQ9 family protein [Reyranella sp. MMS21-HV4-11]